MPEIGEIKTAKELGRRSDTSKYVFQPCPNCGNARWVRRTRAHKLCAKCARHEYLESRSSGRIVQLLQSGNAKMDMDGTTVLHKHYCRVCGTELWHQKRDIDRTCSLKCTQSIRLRWDNSPSWNGGKRMNKEYIEIRVRPDDPYYAMANNGYILEHRLVMARRLGRCLEPWEIVHHIDGNRGHNDYSNLELHPNQASHVPSIALQKQVNKLQARVDALETQNNDLCLEVSLLKWHIIDLEKGTGNPEPSLSKSITCRQEGVETRTEGTQPDNVHKPPAPQVGDDIVRSSQKCESNFAQSAWLSSPSRPF